MAGKKLSDYLMIVGKEIHDNAYMDDDGVVRPITRDEALARVIWRRALGWSETIPGENGTFRHLDHLPDPKAQVFIIERREGKNIIPVEELGRTLLDKISDLAKDRANAAAEKSIDESKTANSDT